MRPEKTFDVEAYATRIGYKDEAKTVLVAGFNSGYNAANWADAYNAGARPECVIPEQYLAGKSEGARNFYANAYTSGYSRGVMTYQDGYDLVNY